VRADFVNRQDVGMIQRGGRARFLLEATEAIGIVAERCRQHFNRDFSTEPRIAGAIDLPHAARAKHRQDFVRAETTAGSECHQKVDESHRF
jgi:hypothetical protein